MDIDSKKEYVLNLFNALFNNNIVNLYFMSEISNQESFVDNVKDYVCDKILDVLTYFRKTVEQPPQCPTERLKISSIHQIKYPDVPKLIANETDLRDLHQILLESDVDILYHLEYKYDDTPFRIILKKDQLHKIHDIVEEENHPSSEIESINFKKHNSDGSTHMDYCDLMLKYAGPVGDFYQFLDLEIKHHESDFGKYLLTGNCESYLLKREAEHYIQVEDILGQEYIFRH